MYAYMCTLSRSCFKTVFVPTSNNPHTSLNNYWKTSVLQRKRFYSPAAALNRLCTSTGVCSRRALSELPFVACSIFFSLMEYKCPMQAFWNGLLSLFSNTLKTVCSGWDVARRGRRTACYKILKAGRLCSLKAVNDACRSPRNQWTAASRFLTSGMCVYVCV